MVRTLLIGALTIASIRPLSPLQPTSPPDTEIFLAPLTPSQADAVVGAAANITNNPGYDNQPSFAPDGRSLFFTSIRGGGTTTDIYQYDIASRTSSRVTSTPEGEYSATVTPDGAHISVVRVEADGTQRLWRFTLAGRQPEIVLERVKPVGYHAWADDHTLALFVLGQPATLQVADTRTGNAEVLLRGVGRSLQRIPGRGTISVVERDADGALWIRELDPKTRRVTPLIPAVTGSKESDCAWTPDGMLMMAEKDILYGWRRGEAGWRRLADLAALGLQGVTRIAVSPKGDQIAFVTQARQP
jgi:dipeptidyl aminopeptidase/acylaminoacyl peptidase